MNGFSKDRSILKGMVMMIDCYSNEGIHRINMNSSRYLATNNHFNEGWDVLERQYLCVRQIVVCKARIILELQSTFTGG